MPATSAGGFELRQITSRMLKKYTILKITKIINKTNRARMRFVFEDHEGEENQVDFDLLQSLLLEEVNDVEAAGVDEATGN